MTALELLEKTKTENIKALDGIALLRCQARTKGTVEVETLSSTLDALRSATSALQSFECLVRTGRQPESGEQ